MTIVSCVLSVGKGNWMSQQTNVLLRLSAVIEQRKARRPPESYTTKLLDGGPDEIGAKIREEASELVDAARAADGAPGPVIHEAADLVYHLLVMLAACDVKLADVEAELARRFGTSGLDEKASREDR